MSEPPRSLALTAFLLTLIEFLQSGMVGFGAVPIQGEISASPEQYSLLVAMYASVAIVVIAKHRWLTERMGWRTYVLASIAIHIMGCALCSVSNDLSTFAAGRILMAMGGASYMTISRILVNHFPVGRSRATAIQYFVFAVALGTALGPVLILTSFTKNAWHAAFHILIVLDVVLAANASRCLPKYCRASTELSESSLGRVLLLSFASLLLLYTLQRAYYDFYNERYIECAFVLFGVFSLFTYFKTEHDHRAPMLMIRRLTNRRYVFGMSLFCIGYAVTGANNYVLPLVLQSGLGFSWDEVGRVQSLGSATELIAWIFLSRIARRFPAPKKFLVIGFSALAAYGWILSSISPAASLRGNIFPALTLNSLFIVFGLITVAGQSFNEYAGEERLFSHAYQVRGMLQQVGVALGTSIATIFMQWRVVVEYGSLSNRMTVNDPGLTFQVKALSSAFSGYQMAGVTDNNIALGQVAREILQQANLLAGIDYFWILGWIGSALALVLSMQKIFR
jgi:MFS transporter, DHA2 family, multidrug resistance protein